MDVSSALEAARLRRYGVSKYPAGDYLGLDNRFFVIALSEACAVAAGRRPNGAVLANLALVESLSDLLLLAQLPVT